MKDLETLTLDELFDEIKKRTTGAILIFDAPGRQGPTAYVDTYYHGCSLAHIMGLLKYAKISTEAKVHEIVYDIDETD